MRYWFRLPAPCKSRLAALPVEALAAALASADLCLAAPVYSFRLLVYVLVFLRARVCVCVIGWHGR